MPVNVCKPDAPGVWVGFQDNKGLRKGVMNTTGFCMLEVRCRPGRRGMLHCCCMVALAGLEVELAYSLLLASSTDQRCGV